MKTLLAITAILFALAVEAAVLTWQDNSRAPRAEHGFAIERRFPGGDFEQIATVAANVTKYTDRSLITDPTDYRVRGYIVRETEKTLNSGYSNTARWKSPYTFYLKRSGRRSR